jgi:endonuclease-3 related protein
MNAVSLTLCDVYSRLRQHFGYAPKWWPGPPKEILVTALLVQQCSWSAARAAVLQLRAQGLLSLARLAAAEPDEVQQSIRGVTFAPTKSQRLIRLAQAVRERGFQRIEEYLAPARDTAELRRDLLSLDGIGEETADSILLFASHHATFVIDAYTRRALRRLGLFPDLGEAFWDQPYGQLQQFFERHLRADLSLYDRFALAAGVPREVALFRDWHAQLVELGKHHCLKRSPRCHAAGEEGWKGYRLCEKHCRPGRCTQCPLASLCAWARQTTGALP